MFCNIKYGIVLWIIALFLLPGCPIQAWAQDEYIQEQMQDGVVLKVYLEQGMDQAELDYARNILSAASSAYQDIVFKYGFDRKGFTFSQPTMLFGYDHDQTIEIMLRDVQAPFAFMAPTSKGGLEYQAKVFLPRDYQAYQQRYNITQPALELRASLIHELLHIIIYSYNRNMQTSLTGKVSLTSQNWDWYSEGLARYFEVLVGYREEFLSPGYRHVEDRIVRVYKGGVNYFAKYPDRPLNDRKYDFALFWQYVHKQYGMDKIEEISVRFRDLDPTVCTNQEAMQIVANTLGVDLEQLFRDFSLYVYEASSIAAKKEQGLDPVWVTEMPEEKSNACASISSFGFDYYEFNLDQDLDLVQFRACEDVSVLAMFKQEQGYLVLPIERSGSGNVNIDVSDLPREQKLVVMLSNPTDYTVFYRIRIY